MQYMGGKHYLKKKLTAAILAHTPRRGDYHEPFLGGANMFEEIAPHFERLFISDVHPDLIMLYSAVANGWDPPSELSRDLHAALKNAKPSAIRGFAGFGVSFGGIWFSGYAKDNPNQRYAEGTRNVLIRTRSLLQRATIQCKSYEQCSPRSSSVVYADPPYRGTTAYKDSDEFDHDRFWKIMQAWSMFGTHVFVSEYTAPDGWVSIWESEALVRIKRTSEKREKRTEKLFVWKG